MHDDPLHSLLQQGLTPPDGGDHSWIPPQPEVLSGVLPRMEVLELLGQGGAGAVYRARQTHLDRIVALKVLNPRFARQPTFAERFRREARALARLTHPNIIAIHDIDEQAGWHYLIMEFVDGATLRQTLRTGRFTPLETLRLIPQLCDALAYAHEQGVVHRDFKPENILMDAQGRPRIADFGLAKLIGAPLDGSITATGEVLGTAVYMAPEQMAAAGDVDHRADLYALGVVIYEMLTGRLPIGRFEAPSQTDSVDHALDAIVLRALERSPQLRWQSAQELAAALRGTQSGSAPAGITKSGIGRLISTAAIASIVGIVVVVTMGATGLLSPRSPELPARDRAADDLSTAAAPVMTAPPEMPMSAAVEPPPTSPSPAAQAMPRTEEDVTSTAEPSVVITPEPTADDPTLQAHVLARDRVAGDLSAAAVPVLAAPPPEMPMPAAVEPPLSPLSAETEGDARNTAGPSVVITPAPITDDPPLQAHGLVLSGGRFTILVQPDAPPLSLASLHQRFPAEFQEANGMQISRSSSAYPQVSVKPPPNSLQASNHDVDLVTKHIVIQDMQDVPAPILVAIRPDDLAHLAIRDRAHVDIRGLRREHLHLIIDGSTLSMSDCQGDVLQVMLTGGGQATLSGSYRRTEFTATNGTINATTLTTDALHVTVSGQATATLDGTVQACTVIHSGTGVIRAKSLHATRADVTLTGSGGIALGRVQFLDATCTGRGVLTYAGNPRIGRMITSR